MGLLYFHPAQLGRRRSQAGAAVVEKMRPIVPRFTRCDCQVGLRLIARSHRISFSTVSSSRGHGITQWGDCSDCGTCPADFDGDCSVGILDLLILLGNWTA